MPSKINFLLLLCFLGIINISLYAELPEPKQRLKMENFKMIALVFLWSVLALSCDIVEVTPDQNSGPTGGNTSDVINTGSEIIPSDSVEFAALLHGNSSRVWSAEEFTIAGLSVFQSCRLDDQIQLINDGTYSYDGGSLLCGAEDNQQFRQGTWEIDFTNARLIFDRGTELETSGQVITLEDGVVVLGGEYESDLFGTFDVAGRYSSSN